MFVSLYSKSKQTERNYHDHMNTRHEILSACSPKLEARLAVDNLFHQTFIPTDRNQWNDLSFTKLRHGGMSLVKFPFPIKQVCSVTWFTPDSCVTEELGQQQHSGVNTLSHVIVCIISSAVMKENECALYYCLKCVLSLLNLHTDNKCTVVHIAISFHNSKSVF